MEYGDGYMLINQIPYFEKGNEKERAEAQQIVATVHDILSEIQHYITNLNGEYKEEFKREIKEYQQLFVDFQKLVENERHPKFWIENRSNIVELYNIILIQIKMKNES